jgi:predicted ATP-dependent protease
MLREDMVEAVKSEKFHVWAVKTVDEGIEILTGVSAGERTPDGRFPEATVNFRVEQRLQKFAECLKEFPEEGEKAKSKRSSSSRK